ncbi:MAG: hypothetical protein HMLKMBBP_00686 [Planctomycetes bacterium]|nr:hypothetical protein [Planctomycetota bacterium]
MPPSDPAPSAPRPTLSGHLAILRADHWFKNVFVLPGVAVAVHIDRSLWNAELGWRLLAGLAATCLVASSNYVLNELVDAPSDRHHPTKASRPVPSGRVSVPLAYAQWLAVGAAGVGGGWSLLGPAFGASLLALWVMGCLYNVRPVRTKDVAYVDVLSESVNNPLRMLAGWYLTGTSLLAPTTLLVSYWMVGAYFMAMKRYAEYRMIGDPARAAAYRKSFATYTQEKLLASIVFYASAAMLFFGAFLMRYRVELVLAFPLVAMVMARYMALSFEEDSAVQRPEGLWRDGRLMLWVVLCAVAIGVLLFVDVPFVQRVFPPTRAA